MPRNTGYIKDTYNPKDIPYTPPPGLQIKDDVDLSITGDGVKHPEWLEPVYDQNKTDSCVANATAACYRFIARKLNETAVPAGHTAHVTDPSRLFIYYNARAFPKLQKDPSNNNTLIWPTGLVDKGSEIRDAMKSLHRFGIVDDSLYPWDALKTNAAVINQKPDDSVYAEAAKCKIHSYCRLDPWESANTPKSQYAQVGATTLERLKQCLSEGSPVVFGIYWFWNNVPWVDNKFGDGLPALPGIPAGRHGQGPDGDYGAHAIMCIGYDNDNGAVLIQDSDGDHTNSFAQWWMPYEWVTDWEATDDFWMIRLLEPMQ